MTKTPVKAIFFKFIILIIIFVGTTGCVHKNAVEPCNSTCAADSDRIVLLDSIVFKDEAVKTVVLPMVEPVNPLLESIISEDLLPVLNHRTYKGKPIFSIGYSDSVLEISEFEPEKCFTPDLDFRGVYNYENAKFIIEVGAYELFKKTYQRVDTFTYYYLCGDMRLIYDPRTWYFKFDKDGYKRAKWNYVLENDSIIFWHESEHYAK